VDLGTATIRYVNPIPGQAFAVQLVTFKNLPFIPAGKQLIVWGDVVFSARGCPRFGASLDDTAPPEEESQMGLDSGDPPEHDPTLRVGPDAHEIVMDMNPFTEITDPGTDVLIVQIGDDAVTRDLDALPEEIMIVEPPDIALTPGEGLTSTPRPNRR